METMDLIRLKDIFQEIALDGLPLDSQVPTQCSCAEPCRV